MLGAEIKVRVVRDNKAKAVSLEVNGAKTKGSSFEPKAGDNTEVIVRIPA
jgi:cyclic beta-1,2-glucan synthetase